MVYVHVIYHDNYVSVMAVCQKYYRGELIFCSATYFIIGFILFYLFIFIFNLNSTIVVFIFN